MAGAQNKADETKPGTTDLCDLFDHLSIGEKSKLKWKGGRQELKSFVETTLSLAGKWSSDDSTPKFKSNGISITFYDTQTLRIQGKNGKELKRLLLDIASETGDTRVPLIKELSDFLRSSRDENKCNGECSKIYLTQDGHIKQREIDERFLGSKHQFCAAFYHVHEWSNRYHFCLDEDNCIIAQKAKKRIRNFEDDVMKFGAKFAKEADQLVKELKELAKKPKTSYQEEKEFVEKAV